MLINVDWCPSVHFVLKITPISRALDEWEVFLDNVNRKEIALRLLNFGLTNKDFQFIFIRFDQTWLDLIATHLIPFFQSPRNWRYSRRIEGRRQRQSEDCRNQEKCMKSSCFLPYNTDRKRKCNFLYLCTNKKQVRKSQLLS